MHRWITEVCRNRIPTVFRLNPLDRSLDLIEGTAPAYALPAAARTTDRMAQAIFVRVNVLKSDRLWTDISPAERVVLVTANIERPVAFIYDLDAAHRFAEITAATVNVSVVKLGGHRLQNRLAMAATSTHVGGDEGSRRTRDLKKKCPPGFKTGWALPLTPMRRDELTVCRARCPVNVAIPVNFDRPFPGD